MDSYQMHIAVIDDGVNEKLYSMNPLQFNIDILPDLTIIEREEYDPFLPSHGTTCASIIRKYSMDVSIGSIKILNDESKRGVKYQLIKALQWCVGNDVKLVNLSLGTIDFRDFSEIKDCINDVASQGLIIIAACNNKNVYTVPACLTNVIGVKCKRTYIDDLYEFYPYSFDGIDIAANGRHFLTDISGNGRYTNPSNSFAAPLITAMAYKIINTNPLITLEGIKKELNKGAVNFKDDNYDPYVCMNTDWCTIGWEDVKVWDAGLYKEYLQKGLPDKSDEIDIPVILIYEPGNTDVYHNLNELFRKDGYYSAKVSFDCVDAFRNSEYLPCDVDTGKFLAAVYDKYNCDIILIKANNVKYMKDIVLSVEIDIVLYATDTNSMCLHAKEFNFNMGKYKPIMIETSGKDTENQVRDIYNKILTLLDKP